MSSERPDDSAGDGRLVVADFDYPFPEGLVAQEPLADRAAARLLVRQADGATRHRRIADLTSELDAGTLLVVNDTRVFPSRLQGNLVTGGQVELFLMSRVPDATGLARWRCLGRPLKKLKVGTRLKFAGDAEAVVLSKWDDAAGGAFVDVEFDRSDDDLAAWTETHGFIPLPPYIKRPDAVPARASADRDRYQTVYARTRGSVAAPTAGLHLTDALLAALAAKGVRRAAVTLHVGGGTFLPVKVDRLQDHRMHTEHCRVGADTLRLIRETRAAGKKVVAVGTTSLRALEDLMRRAPTEAEQDRLADTWHATDIFIRPERREDRYRPKSIDGLITNFHQPRSTLFMLISALIGIDAAKGLYGEAIAESYRLYSYGDATLLWL